MADSCSTCFFFVTQTVPDENGNNRLFSACRKSAPAVTGKAVSRIVWPSVQGDDWCGDFATNYDNAINMALNAALASIAAAAAQTSWGPGDGKITFKTTADSGWIMADDGTIGDATSGASNRANADCQALFLLLWGNIADADAPVVGGRGASAAADWAAHKKITLTKQLGQGIAIGGAGAGLTARTLGHADGAETHTLVTGNLPAHSHVVPDHTHGYNEPAAAADGTAGSDNVGAGAVGSATAGSGPLTTSSIGSGTAVNHMPPRTYWNVMIKL